jgi:RimJ/RimL family protein N-acetyltransferase
VWQPQIHVAHFLEVIKANPDLFTYVEFPAIDTEADFMREVYDGLSASPEDCLYAIFDKTTAPGTENSYSGYSGVISLAHTNPVNAVTEMGVITFPAFQRTHVATNAIGLLLL